MGDILLAVFVFSLLMTFHEFGHFIIAKWVGVRVDEFSLGVGPKLVGYKPGETLYSVRALPFFGYVRMAGMEPFEPSVEPGRGFMHKSVLQRMGIIAAGPGMNFLLAALLFASIFGYFGVPQAVGNMPVIGEVMRGYPAEEAGLRPGDKVLAINGSPVYNWMEMVKTIQQNAGVELTLKIERDGQELTVKVVPRSDPEHAGKGFIGIAPQTRIVRYGFLEALKRGLLQAVAVGVLWFKSMVMIFTKKAQLDLAGPVGIISMLNQASRMGLANLVSLAGALSAILGLINLLPIPAMDGSRLMFLTVEGLRGKPIDPKKENFIHLVGFALLMLLAIVVTYRDFLRIFVGWD